MKEIANPRRAPWPSVALWHALWVAVIVACFLLVSEAAYREEVRQQHRIETARPSAEPAYSPNGSARAFVHWTPGCAADCID